MKKALLTAVLTMVGSVGLVGLGAGPAAANLPVPPGGSNVGCYQYACDNKGPVAQNCDNDAVRITTVRQYTAYGPADSQLIFSAACQAYWARGISLNSDQSQSTGYYIRIEKRKSLDNSLTYQYVALVHTNMQGAAEWTNMAGKRSGYKIRGCVNVPKSFSGDGAWHCTAWRTS